MGSRCTAGVWYHHWQRAAPFISQHTGFLNAGARACACTHKSALGLARAHGALARPRHLPFPSEERPNRKRAELVKGGGNAFKDGRQSTVGKNGQDGLRGSPKKNTSRGPEQAGLGSAEAERSP